MMLLITTTAISIASKIKVENNSYEKLNEDIENEIVGSKVLFPNIPRIFNKDWNYWKNKPDLFLIPSGNVGIGTESPSEKLDVIGTVEMTGFKLPTDASEGYVLTSNAQGIGTWQAPSSGGNGISGTINTIAKFITSTTVGDSVIHEDDGKIGIGINNPDSTLHVDGDLTVTGEYKGDIGPNNGAPFPRPAYDSGWVPVPKDDVVELTHNIGGNVDNYVVDLTFRDADGEWGINHIAYGGRPATSGWQGGEWHNLTSTSIWIGRYNNDPVMDEGRVRIWVYN